MEAPNDRAIKLTTALYFTPNGRSIQATGIVPDIIVDRGQVTRIPDSLASYREADLTGHLPNATPENNDQSAAPVVGEAQQDAPPSPEVLVQDYQLNEAVNVLKGLNLVRPKANLSRSQTQLLQDIEGTSPR